MNPSRVNRGVQGTESHCGAHRTSLGMSKLGGCIDSKDRSPIDTSLRRGITAPVRQSVALFALIAWITCYAQCVGRLSGADMEGDPCCGHDRQEQPAKEPQKSCGVCDAFVAGGIEVGQPLLIWVTLIAVAVITHCIMTFSIPFRRLLEAFLGEAARWRSWKAVPRRTVPLWEQLVRTARPVRGPALAAA